MALVAVDVAFWTGRLSLRSYGRAVNVGTSFPNGRALVRRVRGYMNRPRRPLGLWRRAEEVYRVVDT